MAGGTTVTPLWERAGDCVPYTVGTAAITLGQAVVFDAANTGTVLIGTNESILPAGVAIAARRLSRTQTDDEVAIGEIVDVATKGNVYLTATAAAIAIGDLVQCAASGEIKKLTVSASTDVNKILGRALTPISSAGGAIKVRLLV